MIHEEYMKLKEDRQHGNFLLPYVWYYTSIPEFFSSFPMHWHDEFEIIFVQHGRMNISIDLEQSVVSEGDIIILKPGTLHSFSQYENENSETITCVFNISMLNAQITDACSMKYFSPILDGKYTFPCIMHKESIGYQDILNSLIEMHDIYYKKDNFYEIQLKSLLFKMFYYILNDCCSEYVDFANNNSETDTIKKIIDYIQLNYMRPISIAELAKSAGLSEHYFMRFFKSNLGITCVEYMNDYRLNVATHLLHETDYPIGVIAQKCGIPNVSYFNRIFKKSFNVTPKDYRKRKY